jgi:hypothetical protein
MHEPEAANDAQARAPLVPVAASPGGAPNAGEGDAAASPKAKRRPYAALTGKVLFAHAYPLGFAWAVASIPLAIHSFSKEIAAIEHDADALGSFVVGTIAWPAAIAFGVAHLFVLPWCIAREPRRGLRAYLVGFGAAFAVAAVGGGASWVWLHLRALE